MTVAALAPDPALPGLELALDPDAMRDLLSRHLQPLPPSAWEIMACRVSRLHYHRGDRCTLRYTLRLVEPESGHERSQWVKGSLRAGDSVERLSRKLQPSDAPRDLPFEPLAFIPEAGMLVEVFPYDRRLPTLPRLATDRLLELEPVVRRELQAEDRRIDEWRVDPVQYRPARVAVLRHTVRASSLEKRFYVKVYRHEEEGRRSHRLLQTLWERGGERGLAVPKPVAYLSGLRALVTAELGGESLRHAIDEREDLKAAGAAARALATAQLEPMPELVLHDHAGEVAVLMRAAQLLEWARPDLGARMDEVVRALAARREQVPPKPTHRELRSDHLFLDGSRVGVIDVDSYAVADPLLDPARLLADLVGLSLRPGVSGGSRWERAAGTFADEYRRSVPIAAGDRLFVRYAGALLKEALDVFRHQEPCWAETVGALVEEAENALAGRAMWAA
jgi:hypothetical protein